MRSNRSRLRLHRPDEKKLNFALLSTTCRAVVIRRQINYQQSTLNYQLLLARSHVVTLSRSHALTGSGSQLLTYENSGVETQGQRGAGQRDRA